MRETHATKRRGGLGTETRSSGMDNEGELTAEGIYSVQKTTAGRSSSRPGNESVVKGLPESSVKLNVSLWCGANCQMIFSSLCNSHITPKV